MIGGLACGYVSSSTTIPCGGFGGLFSGSSSGMQAGQAVGAGSEYALTNDWSVKFEYLYIDLGSTSHTYAVAGPYSVSGWAYTINIDTAEHIIRVGLNYKFRDGCPGGLIMLSRESFMR